MVFPFYFFIFLIGLAVGSFLGVVVDRSQGNESLWKGRSHCDHCRHTLHVLDLIPVLSFVTLGGKCRYCHKKLSWFYPIIELVTGAVFVITAVTLFMARPDLLSNTSYLFVLLYYLVIFASLIAIVFTDIKYGIIPFKIVAFMLLLTLFWYLLLPGLYLSPQELARLGMQTNILNALSAGLGAFSFFF